MHMQTAARSRWQKTPKMSSTRQKTLLTASAMSSRQITSAAMFSCSSLCEVNVQAVEKACTREESWRGKECFSWLLFVTLFHASQPG